MKGMGLRTWRLWGIDIAGVAICGAVTIGLYLTGMGPLFRRHAAVASLEEELLRRNRESRGLAVSLGELRERDAEVQKALSASPLRLQTVSYTNRQLAEIAELAAQCGMKVNEIRPRSVLSGERYEVVPMHLSGEGSYPTCVRFLHRLRREFPDTAVVSLDLSCNPTDPTSASFKFSLEWYAAPTPRGKE
jgi:Tfp pilus assembly protein PilO